MWDGEVCPEMRMRVRSGEACPEVRVWDALLFAAR